tara:strand:- start:646 stop:1524 length:879 start_codon:yes stop_codon:yes gene_type:complete
MNILNTPDEFLDFSVLNYPNFNEKPGFEAYFYDYFISKKIKSEYTYIPIQWTNYFVKQNYGEDIEKLKNFLKKNLSPTGKYFTVIQYDGGPLLELENCLIFNMGGMFSTRLPTTSRSIPLPLIYEYNFMENYLDKKYLASYLGRPTHKIRTIIEKKLKNKKGFYIENLDSMNSKIETVNLEKYENLIKSSHFFLCPRGYGPASFRLYESIELGTIPVYISDKFVLPFEDQINWKKFSVLIKKNKIGKLPKILDDIINSQNYEEMLQELSIVKDNYFNLESTAEYIHKKIENK